ncbi:hypothetical protein EBU99_02330 [bacterium]|nr:hypothetical protein [bacterium]
MKLQAHKWNDTLKMLALCTGIGVALAFASACSPSPSLPKSTSKNKASSIVGPAGSGIKAMLPLSALNDSTLRLNKLGVTRLEVSRAQYPAISFSMPEKADYVQILRCRSDAKLPSFSNIEIGANNSKAADQQYEENDYWKMVSTKFGCVVITSGVSVDTFIDFFAGDNSWIYVGRACVQPSRLDASDNDVTISPCSRQVSASNELVGYSNPLKTILREKEASMTAQRDKIDALGRGMVYKAARIDSEIKSCESERGANRASQKRRDALGKLMGAGVSLGAKLVQDTSVKSVLGGLTEFPQIFKDLSAQSADFLPPDWCPVADKLIKELEVDRTQLETETQDYQQRQKLIAEGTK